MRTSALQECRYCVQTHSAVALDHGVTAEEIRALRGGAPWGTAFAGGAERALLAWVDAVAGGHGAVAGELGDALRKHWSEAEIVELALLCRDTDAQPLLQRACTTHEPGRSAPP